MIQASGVGGARLPNSRKVSSRKRCLSKRAARWAEKRADLSDVASVFVDAGLVK